MSPVKPAFLLALLALLGCGIPPVDRTYISNTPANAASFAVAQQAVRACVGRIGQNTWRKNLERAGFGVSVQPVTLKSGKVIERLIVSPPDEAVSVLILGNRCYVGLESMTPSQSVQLAQIWVDAYDALSNVAYGDGLSSHVAGAWRRFFLEPHRTPDKAAYTHRIYITAYKTWPHGPYDPQGSVAYEIPDFPKTPGAAVSLKHVAICGPHSQIGPRTFIVLPCSGSEFDPK